MSDAKSALRVILKNEAGAVKVDFTVFLGESIELAMLVTGVASNGAPEAANANAAPGEARLSGQLPDIRTLP